MIKVYDKYISPFAACYHVDTIEGHVGLPDNSVHFSAFSPPFEGLFCYSASDRDMGNSRGSPQFSEHIGFLAREQFRTLKPGRIVAIHCMELPTTLEHHGYIGFVDFPARLREVYEKAGFIMHCPYITIWKDPEVQANRTYARQLTWGEMVKDSAMSGVGTPDRILIMRKPGKNEVPVVHLSAEQFLALRWFAGERELPEPSKTITEDLMRLTVVSVDRTVSALGAQILAGRIGDDPLAERDDAGKPRHWQRWASPVWSMAYEPEQDAWVALDADKPIEIGTDALMRGLRHAINCGAVERAKLLAGVLAERAKAASWGGQPFPDFVWATANGLWFDRFVDYESPRGGNPDKRGIDQGDTLNFRAAREHEDERHICPLQIGVVDRLIDLYTNPGEIVCTPFMGIGTEVVCAVKKGRRGVGFELKGSYYRQAVEHVKRVEPGAKGQQLGLLDILKTSSGPVMYSVDAPDGGTHVGQLVAVEPAPIDPGLERFAEDMGFQLVTELTTPQIPTSVGLQTGRHEERQAENITYSSITGITAKSATTANGDTLAIVELTTRPLGRCGACDSEGPIGECEVCGGEIK